MQPGASKWDDLFPGPVSADILNAVNAVNIRRMFRLSLVMIAVHAIIATVFLLKDVDGAPEDIVLWRQGIIATHASIAILVCIFSVLCRPGRLVSPREASLYSVLAVVMYLVFGALVAAIDQLVTPAITPFMIASIGMGVTILLPPLRSFFLFSGSIILICVLAGFTQHSPEQLLSLQVNSIAMGFIGFGLNWALFSGKVRELQHLHTIETQGHDLSVKNHALARMNEARDRFFAIIAHDLRGPIGSQAETHDLLVGEYESMKDDERKVILRSLQKSSRKSYELLEDLLRWARSQTGRIPFRPEVFSLHALIHDTVDLVADRAQQKEIQVQTETPGDALVIADRSMIHSVIANLIGNALKFTRRGGTVSVTIEPDGSFYRVNVIDSGVGIPAVAADNLFREGDTPRTPGTEGEWGSGFGLILSRQFIERNGGVIGLESQPGQGTRFYFTVRSADTYEI